MRKKRASVERDRSDYASQTPSPLEQASSSPKLPEPAPLSAMPPAQELAQEILEYDEENPGEPEGDMIVDYATWSTWVDLAGQMVDAEGAAPVDPNCCSNCHVRYDANRHGHCPNCGE